MKFPSKPKGSPILADGESVFPKPADTSVSYRLEDRNAEVASDAAWKKIDALGGAAVGSAEEQPGKDLVRNVARAGDLATNMPAPAQQDGAKIIPFPNRQ